MRMLSPMIASPVSASSLRFSEPKGVSTRMGARKVRTAPLYPDHPGWMAWRHDKEAVKEFIQGLGNQKKP